MLDYINHIIRVELEDGYFVRIQSIMCRRSFVGQFLSYDIHMNIVLSNAKEIMTKGVRRDLPPLPSGFCSRPRYGYRSSWRRHYRRNETWISDYQGSYNCFSPYLWSSP